VSSTLDATGGLLVIADLHLDLSQARGADEFVAWCDALRPVRHLVVLGDLVDPIQDVLVALVDLEGNLE